MINSNETLSKVKCAFELAKLINNLKYKDYKKTIHILKEYSSDPLTSFETKEALNKMIDSIEAKFLSKNKIGGILSRWFNINL